MAKGWPSEAGECRGDVLTACASVRDLCANARLLRGWSLREATADISAAVSDLRRALWKCEQITPAAGQWPKNAKARRDLAVLYAKWMAGKVEILRQPSTDAQALALLAEISDLAAGIAERIETI